MQLRGYQSRAVERIMAWVKKSIEPCLLDAATGAGKSLIVAEVARQLNGISGGKRVLCLAPSAELVEQNHGKYLALGLPASIFSASVGKKSTRHPVVFGTPQSVKRSLSRFLSGYCSVVIDEAHGITSTVQTIIEAMREHNPNLRVIGMSATCYRMGTGRIYRIDENDRPVPESQAADPYFHKLVDRITPRELIDLGYLTAPRVGAPLAEEYDTSGLRLNSRNQFDSKDVDQAFVGHGRKTSAIVGDVVEQARDRMGVMFFGATLEHCREIMASLPPKLSAMVSGDMPKDERRSVIAAFKDRRIKYIVNRDVLTVGFDAPHVDCIALLRRTESAGLLQQIIGRGLRLHDDKKDALILDYAGNIEAHAPDGDIFNPEIKARIKSEGSGEITCKCPDCGGENVFSARKNEEGYQVDNEGYFADLTGARIESEYGPIPAHYGRRCLNFEMVRGVAERCSYRWTFKPCQNCDEPNDIAARRCVSCKGEIIDPNEALQIEFRALKRDPYQRQCDEVVSWQARETLSQSGNSVIRVDVKTPYRSFSFWLQKDPKSSRAFDDLARYNGLQGKQPESITYVKEASGFYRVLGYNEEVDRV